MPIKISLIGAGSAVFSLNLMRDLCLTPNLYGSTINFMDIDKARLDAIHGLCQRYAKEVGANFKLEKTLDRRKSLKDADFVINTALAASHNRLQDGIAIGKKHGYRFGGSYHVMHDEAFWINFYQLRLMESVLQDMLELCPNAWLLQVANPVLAGITMMGRKYAGAKVVGLCHGFGGVYNLADALGLERDQISYEIPGVNHSVWLTHFYYKGQDAFPLIDQWLAEKAPEYWKQQTKRSTLTGPKAFDLYKRFGVFPVGDTANPGGGTWPWWYHTDEATEARWQEDPQAWWDGYFSSCERKVAEIQRVVEDKSLKVSEHYPPQMSGEVMVPMIESIACDIPRTLIANIFNTGNFVPGVPADFQVEIPTHVSKRGIQGIQTHPLPTELISFILAERVAPVNIELKALATGSKELLLQLIMMDPWTRSEDQARSLMEEILALPYHEEMRKHYK